MSTTYATGAQSTTGVRSANPGSQMFFQHDERRAYADAMDHQRHQHVFGMQSAGNNHHQYHPLHAINLGSNGGRYNWYLNARRNQFCRGNSAERQAPQNQLERPSSSNQQDGSPRMRRLF